MQWNATSDPIRSVEFYRVFVQNSMGKLHVHQGAVVFGPPRENGCEILRICAPTPEPAMLYETLSKVHTSRLRERLVLLECSRAEIMGAINAFCHQGLPLPDIFDEGMARLEGLTVFQLACYRQTCLIPHGETRSYGWLAERLKKYGAERAVGGAMKSNPFPLLVPCHRVVKKDGNLGGFMGTNSPDSWQLGLKKTLLDIEGLHQQPSLFAPHSELSSVLLQ